MPTWRRYLTYLTVALMPLSINVGKFYSPPLKPQYRSPFDVLLPVLFLLMLADLFQRRPWARFKWPPLPGILWAALAILSCLWIERFPQGETLNKWANGALNPVFFSVLAIWVFQNITDDVAEVRRLALILGSSIGVCLLWALVQYLGPVGLPFDPSKPTQDLQGVSNIRLGGWYDFRGLLGAQTAILVPAAAAFALLDGNSIVRWSALGFTLVGLVVTLSAGGFVGACAGLVAISAVLLTTTSFFKKADVGKITGLKLLIALLLVISVVLPKLPRNNAAVVARGLSLYADADGEKKPTARLRRLQASLDLFSAPVDPMNPNSPSYWQKGVGAGQFHERVNGFYQPQYRKPGARTDSEADFDMEAHEPFTFSLFETVAVELGVPGLLIVLLFFGAWLVSGLKAFSCFADNPERLLERELALASFGAGCGALVLSLLGNPAIRGVGGSFAFFFAVAILCHSSSTNAIGRLGAKP